MRSAAEQSQRFERVRPRIYRFVQFPASAHADLHVASLQAGPDAAISHDSALALYDLSDPLQQAASHGSAPIPAGDGRAFAFYWPSH